MSDQLRQKLRHLAGGAPVFFLGAFLFFSTFSIAGAQTSLGICFLSLAVSIILLRRSRPAGTPIDIPLALFLAAALLAVLFSEERIEAFKNLKNLLLLVILYLVPLAVTGRRSAQRLMAVLIFSGAASALYGIAVFALGRGEGALGRTPGSFSTAMTFGGVMMLLCSICTGIAAGRDGNIRHRLVALAAASLTGAGLFLSFTRSSWIGMLASISAILWLTRKRMLAPFAVIVLAAYLVAPAPVKQRVNSIFDPGYRTNRQRLELLEGGWRIFRDHWIVGVGPVDLADIYREYKPAGAVHVHGHMHNIFLHIAVTMGAVGLAAFCLFLVSLYLILIGNLRLDLPPPVRGFVAGSIGALTGFIVNGLFEWNFGDAEIVMLLYAIIGFNIAIRVHGGLRDVPDGDPVSRTSGDKVEGARPE